MLLYSSKTGKLFGVPSLYKPARSLLENFNYGNPEDFPSTQFETQAKSSELENFVGSTLRVISRQSTAQKNPEYSRRGLKLSVKVSNDVQLTSYL